MTEEDLQQKVIQWVSARTGLLTIQAYHNKPRPDGPYAMVNLTAAEPTNWAEDIEYSDNSEWTEDDYVEPVIETPVLPWEWTFSVNVYATSAVSLLRKVVSASEHEAGMTPLHPFTINRTSSVRRIPELINQIWEDRAQVDVYVRGLARDGVPVDVIEQVDTTWTAIADGSEKVLPRPPIVKLQE